MSIAKWLFGLGGDNRVGTCKEFSSQMAASAALTKKRDTEGMAPSLIISHGLSCSTLNTDFATTKTRAEDATANLKHTVVVAWCQAQSKRLARMLCVMRWNWLESSVAHLCLTIPVCLINYRTSVDFLQYWCNEDLCLRAIYPVYNIPQNSLSPAQKHYTPHNATQNANDLSCPVNFVLPFRFLSQSIWDTSTRMKRVRQRWDGQGVANRHFFTTCLNFF